MAGRRCLWLVGVVLGAAAFGCAGETARIQLRVEVAEGELTEPPWLTVEFKGHDPVMIDPRTVKWERDPQIAIDLQFQVSGVGPDGVKVDVLGYLKAADPDPVLESRGNDAKPGMKAMVVLTKPMTIKGDAGMDADGGAPDTEEPDGGPDTGPEVPTGDGADGGDAGDAGDAAPPDVIVCTDVGGPDADAGPQGPTCNEYCALMVTNCQDDLASCLRTCTQLRWEDIKDTNSVGNNLRCRVDNASLAGIPGMMEIQCASATWNGLPTGGCGIPCDVLCDAGKVLCPGSPTFSNVACRDACRTGFTPANRDCRVQALIDGDCMKATSGTGCP